MTKFHSDRIASLGRAARAASVVLGLAACAGPSPGQISPGIADPDVAAAYLPLSTRDFVFRIHWGAAFLVAPHVAVTNAHNANLLGGDTVLGESSTYDLLFYRADGDTMPRFGQAQLNEDVIAYGQGADGQLREAHGVVRSLDGLVAPRCDGCAPQRAIAFDADAGPGFSGGPMVDAKTGRIVGVVFGYQDGEGADGGRRIYAYDIALVTSEMRRILGTQTR